MTIWTPVGVLPNLTGGREVFDGGEIAIVPVGDSRAQEVFAALPQFQDLIGRFTNAFDVPLSPMILIVARDMSREAILSFRDIAATSVIPYGRALSTVYGNPDRIHYSNSFSVYPWMLDRDGQFLSAATPAFTGVHVVSAFRGQSSPELPVKSPDDVDRPLFEALLARWRRHYFGRRHRWADRALFRSLDTAMYAAALPASIGTSLFDLGRSISLWVSAFEILAHRGQKRDKGLESVFDLLSKISFLTRQLSVKRYAVHDLVKKRGKQRRPLLFKMYQQLYKARNDFLHGNRVSVRTIDPHRTNTGFFWLAPCAYRLTLSGFLELKAPTHLGYWLLDTPSGRRRREVADVQEIIERAVLRYAQARTN